MLKPGGFMERLPRLNGDASSAVRHQWLEQAVAELRPRFAGAGYTVPDNVRCSIGFPKHVRPKRCIGQCWYSSMSSDQHVEIFVSPELGDAEQTSRIIGVAAHELVHATVGPGVGHRGIFKRCALAIGLTGRMTATTESAAFVAWVNDTVVPRIGPYPAGKIIWQHKKQTTRLVKSQCETCSYPVRTTRVWIDGHGAPHCPDHGAMVECA
jgi:hypothetical protein